VYGCEKNKIMKILRLTLKKKWFDMILSGEKLEEYREVKDYWAVRLLNGFSKTDIHFHLSELKEPYETTAGNTLFDAIKKDFDAVQFINGYAKNAPSFTIECKGIEIGKAKPEWSDNWEGNVFVIKLGKIISSCHTRA